MLEKVSKSGGSPCIYDVFKVRYPKIYTIYKFLMILHLKKHIIMCLIVTPNPIQRNAKISDIEIFRNQNEKISYKYWNNFEEMQ